jgi:heptosyltransferase-2
LYHEKKSRDISLHDVQRNLQIIEGGSSDLDTLQLYPEDISLQDRATLFGMSDAPYVVIAPGSAWKTKRWSENHFKNLVQILSKKTNVVLVGSQEERSLAEFVKDNNDNVLNLCGTLSLSQTLAIVSKASSVICNDSMMLHVASTFKRPVVALFCATSPSFGFGPWQTQFRILESQALSCKPCLRHGSQVCPTGTERCRTDVGVNQVIHALSELECQR